MTEKDDRFDSGRDLPTPPLEDAGGNGAGEAVLPEKKPLKLNYPQTFKVGFAFAIIMLFWTAYDFVVPLLLEHAYGLPNWARGLVMGLDNLLSLFMLPLFGRLSDRSKGKLSKKFGRRTPFIIFGTIASVVLMIFVPISTMGQQRSADKLAAQIESQLNDDQFMTGLLTEWYENAEAGVSGSKNYCDLAYLEKNNISKDDFVAIRFDEKMTSKKAVLNMLGKETFYYDGQEISDLSAVEPVSGKTYQEIVDGNSDYKKFVATGINNYESDRIFAEVTKVSGMKSLGVYMVILLLVLIAMATFRSPAVALMPDVTPKPLRSQANAVINLCGGIGGAIAFLIYTVVLFGERLENYVIIFSSVGAGMLLLLAGFLALVKERKLVQKCHEICEEYGIDDYDENEQTEAIAVSADESMADSAAAMGNTADAVPETVELARAKLAKRNTPKEWWAEKDADEKARFKSFLLILASIFMWFMGYNAISSNLSIYTTKELNLSAGIASIISGVSMGISAIAFIPVGFLAVKIGRRKSIMLGFALAVVSFLLIFAFVKAGDKAIIPAVLFSLFYLIAGFGLIIANVNTFPMVVELSTEATVGQYTGYYYTATMSAQAITPMIGGLIMDYISNRGLFVYSAVCIVAAIVLMIFVKHGDSKQIPTGKKMSKDEKKQVMLEAMESAD